MPLFFSGKVAGFKVDFVNTDVQGIKEKLENLLSKMYWKQSY